MPRRGARTDRTGPPAAILRDSHRAALPRRGARTLKSGDPPDQLLAARVAVHTPLPPRGPRAPLPPAGVITSRAVPPTDVVPTHGVKQPRTRQAVRHDQALSSVALPTTPTTPPSAAISKQRAPVSRAADPAQPQVRAKTTLPNAARPPAAAPSPATPSPATPSPATPSPATPKTIPNEGASPPPPDARAALPAPQLSALRGPREDPLAATQRRPAVAHEHASLAGTTASTLPALPALRVAVRVDGNGNVNVEFLAPEDAVEADCATALLVATSPLDATLLAEIYQASRRTP